MNCEAWRRRQAYQLCFCEENVWRLLADDVLPAASAAVFVTNRGHTVAMWGQRAAPVDPIVWDYHVVALVVEPALIVDLDDREQVARPIDQWLRHAFRGPVEPALRPRFRVVRREQFLATFSSDRSHMRDAHGRPRMPFPAWPAPFQPARGMNLPNFLDLDDPIAGVVTDAPGLATFSD